MKNLGLALLTTTLCFSLQGCGVRGRPQPPLTPAEIGRGQPTFKRATETLAFPNVPSPDASPSPTPRSEESIHENGGDAN